MTDIDKSRMVVKSNKLITARYRLTLMEQKLLVLLISLIKKEDEEFKKYTLKATDIAKFLDIKGKYIYNQLQDITEKILSRVIKIDNEKDGILTQLHWLSKAKYFKRKGFVELSFDPDLKDYLLQLKEQFTKYQLKSVIRFNSIYSIRIYELLKQFEIIGVRTFKIDDLREIFSLNPDEYKFYADLKRKIIITAQKELKKNPDSDIHFEFEEIKNGRKVDSIKFIIYKRAKQKKLPFPEVGTSYNDDSIIETLQQYKLSKNQILELLSYPSEQIISNIQYTERYQKNYEIDNITGFLYSAIKKNYASINSNNEHKSTLEEKENQLIKEKYQEFCSQNPGLEGVELKEQFMSYMDDIGFSLKGETIEEWELKR